MTTETANEHAEGQSRSTGGLGITGLKMFEIECESLKYILPFVQTVWRFSMLGSILKKMGMVFRPTPDSFFFNEKPSGIYTSYYDEKTDTFMHTQRAKDVPNELSSPAAEGSPDRLR